MPTRHLVSWMAVLIAVGYAAVSQGNGPAYLPAYALFSLMLISWLHNRANVQHLGLTTNWETTGFAGAVLLLPFKLRNLKKRSKFGLILTSSIDGNATVGKLELLAEGTISIPKLKRGIHHVSWLEVRSIFPLGIFRTCTRHPVSCDCVIYPEATGDRELPITNGPGLPGNSGTRTTGDDFAGVRNYLLGDSQRHVDWKAVARGQPLMIKQFESVTQREIWIDSAAVSSLELESQLSQLAKWIVECERAGFRYGLQAYGSRIAPASGNTHFHHCLRQLALVKSK